VNLSIKIPFLLTQAFTKQTLVLLLDLSPTYNTLRIQKKVCGIVAHFIVDADCFFKMGGLPRPLHRGYAYDVQLIYLFHKDLQKNLTSIIQTEAAKRR
jgi:hypothetical protein